MPKTCKVENGIIKLTSTPSSCRKLSRPSHTQQLAHFPAESYRESENNCDEVSIWSCPIMNVGVHGSAISEERVLADIEYFVTAVCLSAVPRLLRCSHLALAVTIHSVGR